MKKRNSTRASKTRGLPPGTLVHVGDRRVDDVEITVIDFDESDFREHQKLTVDDCMPFLKSKTISWINIVGLHDIALLGEISEKFSIHPLVMEDILNTEQRPKVQDLGDSLFVVLRMIRSGGVSFESEQVSIILRNQCVVTFQEQSGDVFEAIRERIRNKEGRIRVSGADYLVYALIDSVVDGYFPYLENLGESLEETEERILESPTMVSLQEIFTRKRELIGIRKGILPMRDIVDFLDRGDTLLITRSTNIYLKDVHYHIVHIGDIVEGMRDEVTGLLELYMSTSTHRMNEVMKVLTIIATIFIPLTFVVGIYGMNFVHMPELEKRAAYPIVLLVMAGIAVGMILFFKRKKWL